MGRDELLIRMGLAISLLPESDHEETIAEFLAMDHASQVDVLAFIASDGPAQMKSLAEDDALHNWIDSEGRHGR